MIDICVFAMRGRPFGAQHLYNIKQALEVAQYCFVTVGSANEPINFRNPFTAEQVHQMVRGSLTPAQNDRVFLFAVEDQASDMQWVKEVQRLVTGTINTLSFGREPKIALIGHSKDDSSYYLKLFPQWSAIDTENYADGMSATNLRNALYEEPPTGVSHLLEEIREQIGMPLGTYLFLRQWINSPEYWSMRAEYDFSRAESGKFGPHPYNNWHWHETADTCLFQGGAVLLVRRGEMPGKGLWALPGGHRQMERFRDTALRELCEETSILELNPDLTIDDLRLAVRAEKVFDDPWRSTRMVTTTVAFGLILPGTSRLEVKGADDAHEARWWNLDEVTRSMMFEDHFQIINHFANQFDIK